MAVRLDAVVTVVPEQAPVAEAFTATCTLRNNGDEPVSFNATPLASPSLALEVQDEHGERVLFPPPSVPPATIPVESLVPGARRVAEFRAFLPAWTPPGAYRLRFRYVAGTARPPLFAGTVVSDWVPFRLVP